MRTETTTIEIYSFNELTEEAKQKAIKDNYDINVFDDWFTNVYEDFKENYSKYFNIDRFYFSGFWSQGDGAMFQYTDITDVLKEDFINSLPLSQMRKNWLKNNVYVSGKGLQSGNYYHEKSCYHNIDWQVDNGNLHYNTNFYKWIESFESKFEKFITDFYEDICKKLYKDLETEYNYLTEDNTIAETLISNDYEFTKDGARY